ncbi:uncharacterized protein LOC130672967 [Microplitis mediator]|uniref:uncharacterized protein LOC130672967 n=1 Tax=Microplitis mediator TaxID=375433 RepID=UPI002552A38C|nr:uncharacterized protein LOC130672967 [Microplitis mediator]
MNWIRQIIWWLIAVNSLNIIYFSNASIPAQVSEQLKFLLKSCFADRLNPVIISEDLTDIAYTETTDPSDNVTFFETDYPIIVIDGNFRAKNVEPYYNPRYPTYVLSVKSVKKLEKGLRELASLSTWNVNSHFFIVRHNHNNCDKDGEKVLKVLWKMDLLSSFYVCLEPNDNETIPTNVIADTRTMLYTFNPFSNHAPLPWQEIHRVKRLIDDNRPEQDQDKHWTLYKQSYSNDTKLCPSLTFDKTKHLNGYPIRAILAAKPNTTWTPNHSVNMKELGKVLPYPHFKLFETLFSSLNVTHLINYRNHSPYANNTPVGYLKTIINGTHDVCLNLQYITNDGYKLIDIINPGPEDDLFGLTKKNGTLMPVENNRNFKNYKLVLIVLIVLLISYIIIILNNINNNFIDDDDDNNDPAYGNSFLDIIRFIISSGISARLTSYSMRLMFVTMTLFVFIICPELQGEIISLSTTIDHRYPASIKDLFYLDYNVYIQPALKNTVIDMKLELNTDVKRLHAPLHSGDCYNQLWKDDTTACVYKNQGQFAKAFKHNLHVFQTFEISKYIFFCSRKNFPLKNKIDQIALRIQESGLFKYWETQNIYNPFNKLKAKEAVDPFAQYDAVDFEDLEQVYCFLAAAMGLSVVIFIIEIMTDKIKNSRRQDLIRERQRKLKIRLEQMRRENVNNRFLEDKVRIVNRRVVILP